MRDAVVKLDPRKLLRNPVIFVTEIVAAVRDDPLRTAISSTSPAARASPARSPLALVYRALRHLRRSRGRGPGRAQAESLKKTKSELVARRLGAGGETETIPASSLKVGDVVLVAAGELIPATAKVIEGVASVNESAITGESAPVIRESGGDRSAVTGGTQVLSDEIKIRNHGPARLVLRRPG